MNILVIGKFYTEGFALHIAETLVGMGHSVRRFEPGFRSGRIGGRFGYRLVQVRVEYNHDKARAFRSAKIVQ